MADTTILEIITDAAFPLDLTEHSASAITVKKALDAWSTGTDDSILGKVRFPTLASYLNAWLNLAALAESKDATTYFAFMMEAENLIDSNGFVDATWCDAHIQSTESLRLATRLLDDLPTRRKQSNWE